LLLVGASPGRKSGSLNWGCGAKTTPPSLVAR